MYFPFALSKGQTACHFLLKEFKIPLFFPCWVFQKDNSLTNPFPCHGEDCDAWSK